ncbi:hypothetical protein [Spirosoma aerolatum]|uniref:hypothetical protein n=1 Tax=Spirosoma aerolatum TaxID=1211326 RepID=UPI0009AD8B4C|nr:hypothetical protein [Spirosoma aerolatum]
MKSLSSFVQEDSLSLQEMKEVVGGAKGPVIPKITRPKGKKGILIDNGALPASGGTSTSVVSAGPPPGFTGLWM